MVGDEAEESLLKRFPNIGGLAQRIPQAEWATTPLPVLGPEVKTGSLQNGLTYFVRENREPKARAELYLVVGFGSLVEEEEERGIAHIIEHLGFSATKNYENHAIVKFLESIGAPFGACQNAETTFGHTLYTLHVATDTEGLVNESLTVLREFAYYTRISSEDLDKERNVVMEEWRESKNAQGRLFCQYIEKLTDGCKYCKRLPIGKEEVILGVSAETLRAFYRKYYHPARMAVVAVGDFVGNDVVQVIKELFDIPPEEIEPLPRDSKAPERPQPVVPDSDGVRVASSSDPELSFAQGIVDCKRPRQPLTSVLDFRRRLGEIIFHKALGARLLKLTLEPNGPRNFFAVSTETGTPIPALSSMTFQIAPLPGRMRPALRTIAMEIERVKRQGFHEAEIARAKQAVLADFEAEYIEREQSASENFAEEYVQLFLDAVPAPSIEQQARIAVSVLPSIASTEVSDVAHEFVFQRNVVVKIATPPLSMWNPMYTAWSFFQACRSFTLPRLKVDLPNDLEVAEILQSVAAEASLETWPADVDNVDSRFRLLFEQCADRRLALVNGNAPGVSCREVFAKGVPRPVRATPAAAMPLAEEAIGCPTRDDSFLGEELILRNGLRVFLKETDLFDDEIIMRCRKWGGLSEYQSRGFLNRFGRGTVSCEAKVAPMVAMMLGICGLSMESMQECLEGKRINPEPPSLGNFATDFQCGSSPVDLEDLLTLLHLLFLMPVHPAGKSRGRLSLVKLGLLASRLAELRDPSSQFQERAIRCMSGNHPFSRPSSIWRILFLNFSKASAIFNQMVSRPCEWTFVVVGRLPPTRDLLPLLEKYLGSIPNGDTSAPDASGSASIPDLRRGERESRDAVTPVDIPFPPGQVKEDVTLRMVEPKGSTVVCFPIQLHCVAVTGQPQSTEAQLHELFTLTMLIRMLETRLIEVLRFQRGKVYSVSARDDFSLSSPQMERAPRGTLCIYFECNPAEADELVEVTKIELQKLRDGSAAFTEHNVAAAQEKERREFGESVRKNDFWANTILELYFSRCHVVTGEIGSCVSVWWRARHLAIESLSVSSATDALRAFLPEDSASAVIAMRPKKDQWLTSLAKGFLKNLWQRLSLAICGRVGHGEPSDERTRLS